MFQNKKDPTYLVIGGIELSILLLLILGLFACKLVDTVVKLIASSMSDLMFLMNMDLCM